jgi:predicted O-methyltransferase YrrM
MNIDPALFDGLKPFDSHATDYETLGFLFALLEYVKPRVIVEAGTYRGHFAVGAARVLPDSLVFTSDIKCHETLPEPPNLAAFLGDFEAMLDAIDVAPFDFAFIDSGPPPGGESGVRLRHWRIAKERAAPGAILVCHDMNALGWTGGPEIAAEGILMPGGRGITIWRKPG